jgi:hypothetical protein
MSTPAWFAISLQHRDEPSQVLAFAAAFLAASEEDRHMVRDQWDQTLQWAWPDPWLLAATDPSLPPAENRIRTGLLFDALNYSNVRHNESLMAFAVSHAACTLLGLDAKKCFDDIARAVGGEASVALDQFIGRAPSDRSMTAFAVEATPLPTGGFRIRPNW